MRLALRDQEDAGIDIVTDGEQTRRHFVTTFIEALDGVDFEHKQDRAHPQPLRRRRAGGRRPGRAPRARCSSTTRASCARRRARSVKFTLPGPMTMVDTLYDDHYRSREKLAWAFAEILNEEAREIEAAGVDVIQFDEPAFNVYFDEVRDWGVADARARRAGPRAARPPCTSATATASRPTSTGRRRSAREWRQYEQTFPLLARSAIGQVSLECANSHVPIELIALLGGKDVLVGAIDVATDRVETPEEVAATIRAALRTSRPSGSIPAPTAGWCRSPATSPAGKLRALGAGAALVRAELAYGRPAGAPRPVRWAI